jgi:hypothetical protein
MLETQLFGENPKILLVRIVDIQGNPVKGAWIEPFDPTHQLANNDLVQADDYSDANGYIENTVWPFLSYYVRAHADNYESNEVRIDAPNNRVKATIVIKCVFR